MPRMKKAHVTRKLGEELLDRASGRTREVKKTRYDGVYSYETGDGTRDAFMHDLAPDPASGKRRQKTKRGFETMTTVRDARSASLGDVREGTYVERSKLTLGAFLTNEWLPAVEASGKLKNGTLDQYRIYTCACIVPRIGAFPLQDLDGATLNRFYADLGKKLAPPKSVRNTALMLSTALCDAVKMARTLERGEGRRGETPAAKSAEMRFWSPKESKTFLADVAEDRLYALWLLYSTTGMRRGEALGLRWQDVDLDVGRLSIVQTLVVNEKKVRFDTPKTEKSRRSISIPSSTSCVFRRWSTSQKAERLAWGADYEDSGLVFTMENGTRGSTLEPRPDL